MMITMKINSSIAILAALSFSAQADSLSFITLDKSYHYQRTEDYNESHNGRGLEYNPGDEVSYGFLDYDNSFDKPSTALYFTYNNLLIGVANGYEDADKDSIIAGDDIILIAGINVNIKLIDINNNSLALRALITPSVTGGGFNYTYEWR